MVEGNQEDIDLLIACGNELVLVEVKAYSGFTNEQMTSKLDRLNLLHAHYAGLTNVAIRPLRLHLLIASPRPPQRLKVAWPSWGHRGTGVPWIPLEVHASQPVLAVTRCDGGGQSSAGGDFWRILRL